MKPRILYPLGNQSFEKIRREGRVYVDKTRFINELIDLSTFIFLGRPRRFGKSLFLSTLEAYFKGYRELFDGLNISDTETEWAEYPVIHIDMSKIDGSAPGTLAADLKNKLRRIADEYGIDFESLGGSLAASFGFLIETLAKKRGRNVVVLIDEYDVPLHGLEPENDLYKENQKLLRSIFLQCKGCDEFIKFCMVTGVARFNQMSLFSAPNNFTDISMYPEFATICGFTQSELKEYFSTGIAEFAENSNLTQSELIQLLENNYDGYRFSKSTERVFNPLSIIFSLRNLEFGNYWVNTGLTTLFISKLTNPRFELPKLTSEWVPASQLDKIYDPHDPLSLMYQTGYLTITDYKSGAYRLDIPNLEVTKSLTEDLIPQYLGSKNIDSESFSRTMWELKIALDQGQVQKVMEILESIVSAIAYNLFPTASDKEYQKENYYHTIIYLTLMMLKSSTQCEAASSHGRADIITHTENFVYIFEFKMDTAPDGTVESALRQIDERGYDKPYKFSGKTIFKIGVVFSATSHKIADWGIE